jgi:hypothetical protein
MTVRTPLSIGLVALVFAVALPGAQAAPVGPPRVGGCAVFPADNAWNRDISEARVHPRSSRIIARLQAIGGDSLHPDFGENPRYGIPFDIVSADQPEVRIRYQAYGDESDKGPFPVPPDARVEGGRRSDGDRHVLVLRRETCELFELYRAFPRPDGSWEADSGARWDLSSNERRPLGWTSADAAGLPILPGLVRYSEVASGEVRHAIRVTFEQTRAAYIFPATHFASQSTSRDLPPMGMRFRLKASYDISALSPQARVIARAMQRYGLIVADNGSNWFFQGAPSPGWDDDQLNELKDIPGTAFEVVWTGKARS